VGSWHRVHTGLLQQARVLFADVLDAEQIDVGQELQDQLAHHAHILEFVGYWSSGPFLDCQMPRIG